MIGPGLVGFSRVPDFIIRIIANAAARGGDGQEEWFPAGRILRCLESLLHDLTSSPQGKETPQLVQDLGNCQTILRAAERQGIPARFWFDL
jgi:hypothetical protein